jgi:four helix bundle protein
MSPIKSYRDLTVWQHAMDLAESLYRVTSPFPKEEMFGLTSQIRRAAVSVAANIAEGHGRERTQSFIQFLRQSQGSLKELETHLLLAERVGHLSGKDLTPLLDQCESLGKRLRALIRSLQERVGKED